MIEHIQRVEHARLRLHEVESAEGMAELCGRIKQATLSIPLKVPDQRSAFAERIAEAAIIYWRVLAETPGDPRRMLDEIAARARALSEHLRITPPHLLNNAMNHDRKWFLEVRDVEAERRVWGEDEALPTTDTMPTPAPAVPLNPHQKESRLEMVRHAVDRLQNWAEEERERHPPRGQGQPSEVALHYLIHGVAAAVREFTSVAIIPRGTKSGTARFPELFAAVVAIIDPQIRQSRITNALREMVRRQNRAARRNREKTGNTSRE